MKTLRVFIATALIVCLTSAAPVFAKSKTTHKNLEGLKCKTLSMTTVKVSWKKHIVDKYVIYKVTRKKGKEKHKKLKTVSGKKKSAVIILGKNKDAKLWVKGVKRKKNGKKVVYEGYISAHSGLPKPTWLDTYDYAPDHCSTEDITLSFSVKLGQCVHPTGVEIYRKEAGTKKYLRVKTIKSDIQLHRWKDTSVKAGKYYYYKVCSYLKSGKKIYRGKMSRSMLAGAVNYNGMYQVQMESDEDTMTLKLTSDAMNGNLVVNRGYHLKWLGFPGEQENICYKVKSYSLDGKTWINAAGSRDSIVVKAGDSLWIRLNKEQNAKQYEEYIIEEREAGGLDIECEYRGVKFFILQINAYNEQAVCRSMSDVYCENDAEASSMR